MGMSVLSTVNKRFIIRCKAVLSMQDTFKIHDTYFICSRMGLDIMRNDLRKTMRNA